MIRHAYQPAYKMEIVTDPQENAKARELQQQFVANVAWLEAHAAEVYAHRGQHICIAGQELFVADSLDDVLAQAAAAHPADQGCYVRYIPREKVPRIYANQRHLAYLRRR
jgi:hypothetical protein